LPFHIFSLLIYFFILIFFYVMFYATAELRITISPYGTFFLFGFVLPVNFFS